MDSGTRDQTFTAKSYLLGERIEARYISLSGYRTITQTPRIMVSEDGVLLAIFRFGAVVVASPSGGPAPDLPTGIEAYVVNPFDTVETEVVSIRLGDPGEGRVKQDDHFVMADFSPERFSLLADALAKSVALARDEQRMHAVFEKLEPFARALSRSGDRALGSQASLRLLGEALLTQHRMVGRVEVHEKPEILWERPDLVRLHMRLDEEYELSDRARELSRKLKVVEEISGALAEIANARISRRLEIAIVVLIAVDIVLVLFGMFTGSH